MRLKGAMMKERDEEEEKGISLFIRRSSRLIRKNYRNCNPHYNYMLLSNIDLIVSHVQIKPILMDECSKLLKV